MHDMIRNLILATILSLGAAVPAMGQGANTDLGSVVTQRALANPTVPAAADLVPVYQGQNGVATFSAFSNFAGTGGVTVGAAITGTCTSGFVLYSDAGSIGCESVSGTGTVTTVSVATANGISGTVANATSTPAITLTLGAVTPTSVAIGAGSAITSSGAGGALGSNAFTSTAYAPLASPTFTGTVTMPDASTWASGGLSALGLTAGGAITWSGDGILTSPAAATIQVGAADVNGAPVAQTIKFQSALAGSATNTASANTTIIGSLGTGTGTNGNINFQCGVKTTTGTAQATPTTCMTLNGETLNANFPGGINTLFNTSFYVTSFASTATRVMIAGSTPAGYAMGSTYTISWSSNVPGIADSFSSRDTFLSRSAASVVSIGATTGTSTGSLVLTNLTAAGALISSGTPPTGTTGTCSATASGGSRVGTVTSTSICATITGTIILTALPTAPTGHNCWISDRTTAGVVIEQTATTVTSATFVVRALPTGTVATVANDVLQYACLEY